MTLAPTSLYIHVPFCQAKCQYCDFVSYIGQEARQLDYFDALFNELRAQAAYLEKRGELVPLRTLYFGGGTPTYVPTEAITRVVDLVRSLWGFEDNPEITVEANPGSADSEGLAMLYRAGVNRLSVGLQSSRDHLLRRIGRIHKLDDFLLSIAAAKQAGFENISVDLMIGLPGQTMDDVIDSVSLLLSLDLKNVSFYSLIIEEGTPFYAQQQAGQMDDLPNEDTEREMYEAARALLGEAGFHHYEVSNSGLPGYEGRHNLVYWQGEQYAACGLAAAAYLGGTRYLNTDDLEEYIQIYGDGETEAFRAVVQADVIDRDEEMLEFFLLGFRLLDGLDLEAFRRRFGEEPPARVLHSLAKLEEAGLIESQAGERADRREHYRLTRHGIDLANFVFMEFV